MAVLNSISADDLQDTDSWLILLIKVDQGGRYVVEANSVWTAREHCDYDFVSVLLCSSFSASIRLMRLYNCVLLYNYNRSDYGIHCHSIVCMLYLLGSQSTLFSNIMCYMFQYGL